MGRLILRRTVARPCQTGMALLAWNGFVPAGGLLVAPTGNLMVVIDC